jgi:ATP-binding protein involved in chromosome partitioning
MTEQEIFQWLTEVEHPAREDRNLVELGIADEVVIDGNKVTVTLAFPKHPDPLKQYLAGAAKAAIYRHAPGGTEIEIKTVVREPKPQKKQNVNDLTLEGVRNVRHIIGVASGKGGVGKSTVAVNLAVALARLGYRVGLADADVYGPSVPIMTGTEDAEPLSEPNENGPEWILPIEKDGVKWMSIGYFAQPGQALIWRGPMACNALKQMILQVKWDVLDYLLIDMPPGTGDIHISLVNDIPMEGAVVVTTPQDVALADVEKAMDMFRNKNINRTVFGLVENMAWFTPAELPENRYYLFGRDGGARMAQRFGVPLLGQIPIVQSIREDGDAGTPAALSSRPDGLAFVELAGRLVAAVEGEPA